MAKWYTALYVDANGHAVRFNWTTGQNAYFTNSAGISGDVQYLPTVRYLYKAGFYPAPPPLNPVRSEEE